DAVVRGVTRASPRRAPGPRPRPRAVAIAAAAVLSTAPVEGLPEPDLSIHAIGLGEDANALEGRRRNQVALLHRYGLAPTSHVLEIGCGVGWLAYDLAAELDPDAGSYTGFDVSAAAIGWLNENLAPRLPNFRFDLVDARNPRYRPNDGVRAEEVSFPYADRAF